jgi:lysophospholipase L1-like esterase
VIEEGLNGRTTNVNDGKKIWRNGFSYLRPCLETHNPIDLVILMLGTNDMKDKFKREPENISTSIGILMNEIISTALNAEVEASKILVVSPPLVDETISSVSEMFYGAGEKSKRFGKLLKKVT